MVKIVPWNYLPQLHGCSSSTLVLQPYIYSRSSVTIVLLQKSYYHDSVRKALLRLPYRHSFISKVLSPKLCHHSSIRVVPVTIIQSPKSVTIFLSLFCCRDETVPPLTSCCLLRFCDYDRAAGPLIGFPCCGFQ